MMLLTLIPLLAVASAQNGDCECGLFVGTPEDNFDIPLEFVPIADNTGCSAEICDAACDAVAADRGSRDFCQAHKEYGNKRCIGSYWCERLYNFGTADVTDGQIDVYYRLRGCGEDWVWTNETLQENLCCQDGFYEKCGGNCNQPCVRFNACEGGMFIDDQFAVLEEERLNPIPLETLVATSGTSCTGWPSEDGSHNCDQRLTADTDAFFTDLELRLGVPFQEYTYGQYYCQALFYRWGDSLWPEEGISCKELKVRGRMPGCEEDPDRYRWNLDYVYGVHNQTLCCDGDANYVYCDADDCAAAYF